MLDKCRCGTYTLNIKINKAILRNAFKMIKMKMKMKD